MQKVLFKGSRKDRICRAETSVVWFRVLHLKTSRCVLRVVYILVCNGIASFGRHLDVLPYLSVAVVMNIQKSYIFVIKYK